MSISKPAVGTTNWNTATDAVIDLVNTLDPNSDGVISADQLADGSSNKVLTAAERTKLAGIATGATVGIAASTIDAKGDLLAGTADNTLTRLAVGSSGQVLTANPAAATGLAWSNLTGGGSGGGGAGLIDSFFVDVKSFGATGNFVVATGVGTDDTAAIQAAIDSTAAGGANEGKIVLLTEGRYKTTAPLVLKQGVEITGIHELRTKAVNAVQGTVYSASIEFFGGTAENAIQAIGTSGVSISRCAVRGGFSIHDRRTTPTGGSGIYFEKVVNQTVIEHVDVQGFPTGSSVRVTAQSGNSADCVTIRDIWGLGAQYSVNVDRIDNTCFIQDIKCDSAGGAPLLAAVRVSNINGVVLINGVKHENSSTTAATILLDTIFNSTLIDGVVSRVGNGGAVVRLIGGATGGGVTVRGIQRQNSGVLLEVNGSVQDKTITGTRLGFWVGGGDGLTLNTARFATSGAAGLSSDIFVNGRLNISDTSLSFPGKANVKPDNTSQIGLAITAPASHAAAYLRVSDAANVGLLTVNADGSTSLRDLTALTTTVGGALTTTKRTTIADADYSVLATDYIVAMTSLTAPRTITLPAVAAGKRLIIKDEVGNAGTNNITVARLTGPNQLIDGATTFALNQNYGQLELYSNGVNWYTNKAAAAGAGYTDEQVDDRVAALLVPGSGIGISYNDAGNALTISASGSGGGNPVDVQVFNINGTWTKPAGATTVQVVMVGGGGGGGSGRRGAAATIRTGGGGGGGGAREDCTLPASALNATEAVGVGLGGAGGAAITADSTNGAAGATAGASTFGVRGSGFIVGTGAATGGSAGGTGQANGGLGGLGGSIPGGAGGASGGGGGSNGGVSTSSAAAGGGSGGGITAGDVTSGGGGGGRAIAAFVNPLSGSAAGANGAAGSAAPTDSGRCFSAGTGGGSSISAVGGNGGAGGLYGAGGGGGGASANGFDSGAGGAGADGIVIVISQ